MKALSVLMLLALVFHPGLLFAEDKPAVPAAAKAADAQVKAEDTATDEDLKDEDWNLDEGEGLDADMDEKAGDAAAPAAAAADAAKAKEAPKY